MPEPVAKFFLHVTPAAQQLAVERVPFSGLTHDQMRPLVGDRSGNCIIGISRRYFRGHPAFTIVADDDFANQGWPVSAIINDRWFRGAFLVLAERPDQPLLDGLTADECSDARRLIGGPPGRRWPKEVFRNRSRY